ncbi:IS110 family transposase [Saccharothrix longispora]|uniref:IS110 family transposase n=1 Tax=Saccharothrix longispora TaxID=33920 RepID=UPI0028FD2F90|nr:IS110 family transposase [Saccharothrix longispora]MDU0293181.1 IS110 family transposase [Saccharothrix longispora]
MIVIGIDAHKRTHTAVIVNELGRKLATRTIGTTGADHLALLRWAAEHDQERVWAVEDCRNMTRWLEADLLVAGERVTRVPTKLMAGARDAARTHGKSDPIDALAVARAALREPDLPTARLDGPDREVRLLVDAREALVGERTRTVNRLRWHLHELDPGWDPTPRSLDRDGAYQTILARLGSHQGMVARLARALVQHCRQLTEQIDALLTEISTLVTRPAPTLLGIRGCGPLTAAKILGETADIRRFRSRDAYARHNGTAPLPVWSSNRARHRLSRTGNRQLNAALHRIALTQARCHPDARSLLARRRAGGDGGLEALRVLKRHLSDVVYRALRTDATSPQPTSA